MLRSPKMQKRGNAERTGPAQWFTTVLGMYGTRKDHEPPRALHAAAGTGASCGKRLGTLLHQQ